MELARDPYSQDLRVDIHMFNQLTSNYKVEDTTQYPAKLHYAPKTTGYYTNSAQIPPIHRTPAAVGSQILTFFTQTIVVV